MGILGRLFGSPSSRFMAAIDHADSQEGRAEMYGAFLANELATTVDETGHIDSFVELRDGTVTLVAALDERVMRTWGHGRRVDRFPARDVCASAFAHGSDTLALALRVHDTADYSHDRFWEIDRDYIAWLMVGLLPFFRARGPSGPSILPTDEQRSELRRAVADLGEVKSASLIVGIGPDRSEWPALEVQVAPETGSEERRELCRTIRARLDAHTLLGETTVVVHGDTVVPTEAEAVRISPP